jgi:hypothetical protein
MTLGDALSFPARAIAHEARRSHARTSRFRQKFIVGWWAVLTGIAMVGWLVGFAWIGVSLIGRIVS